jgi:hypothetical protein
VPLTQAQMNSKPTLTPQSRPEHPSGSTEIAPASFAAVEASTQNGPTEHHYSALAQMVAEVSQDHAHLRSFIYEFARIKLRKELYPRFLEGAWSEIEDQMRGLENAIDEIEAEFAHSAPVLPFKPQAASRDNRSNPVPRLSAVASRHAQGTIRFDEGGIHTRSLATCTVEKLQNRFCNCNVTTLFCNVMTLLKCVGLGVVLVTERKDLARALIQSTRG